jgi:ribose transport system substrate-binding protein
VGGRAARAVPSDQTNRRLRGSGRINKGKEPVNRTRYGRKGLLLTAMLVVAALVAASCGDDDDSTGSSATTEAGSGTTAAGGEESDGLTTAREIVAQYSKRPTELGLTTPIEGEIPEGKSVYFITCGAPICEAEAPIINEATDILGWDFKVLSTDGSPQQLQNAWDQVVREKPDVVLYTGTPQSVIATQMEQAAENGTFVSGCCTTDAVGTGGLGYMISTPQQVGELGRIMAAWVVADAADQGLEPGVVYLDLPDFAILSALGEEFESNFAELCTDCAYEKIDIGLADLASANDRVVSYLRANPDVKYVVMSVDSVFSLPSALEAAGLDDIRLFGEGAGFANQADIVAGKQAASMIFQAYEIMFAMVDAAARHYAGDEVLESFSPPAWILTKDDIEDPAEVIPAVEDTVAQFTELWGKS